MKRFLESNWSQIAPKMVQHFDSLQHEDLNWNETNAQHFLRKLSKKVNLDEEQLIRKMKELITD